MGGAEPPFLYDHPSKYSFVGLSEKGFNPKAASQASCSPPRPRPKHDGPLIESKEFNRHPDSYFIVPYGNLNAKSMSPRTKAKVKWTRIVQLLLRICALLGAVGMLFCVICIKGTDGTTGWIIRVPPGVAILHTVYAIYHLARSSKGRTPASSASYMLFAAIMDVGLIPFIAFTAMIARIQYTEPADTQGRWTTLFGTDDANYKIIYSTFLISVVDGALHLTSLVISIYLGVIFRKISRLPPDMNPLEDNLTSRHKRNKSSLLDDATSQATTATSTPNRGSRAEDPLISPTRNVPFMHTRNDAHSNLSNVPHSNFSPRMSQTNLTAPLYDQPPSHRSSRTQLQEPHSQALTQRASRTTLPNLTQSPPKPSNPLPQTQSTITRSPTKSSSIYSTNTTPSLSDTNWITHSSPSPSPPHEFTHLNNLNPLKSRTINYQPLPQTYTSENAPPSLVPKPLEMNPPTPPIEKRRQNGYRPLTPVDGNMGAWGPGMVGIGKARAWGGMGGNMNGVGGGRASGGGGGRVVSRSGVEIGERGILPSGGVRAREVSGKVMEEGRGSGGWR